MDIHAAQVLLSCDDVNGSLAFFVERLGFQVQAIFPADHPQVGVLVGYGVCLRLESGAHLVPGVLRLECDLAPGTQSELLAPNGTRVLLVPRSLGYEMPAHEPAFVLSRLADSEWGVGRAGMRYRDLIPGRLGGRFIASHIRIEEGGEVPDYVHFHRVRFQMIYCAKGWVRLVYEDQGEPFLLQAGDCVLQPPEIRHRVLEASAGLEVLEIGCPAEHATCGDPALPLPTRQVDRERSFSGQRFLRHVAEDASWEPGHDPAFLVREIGMHTATGGLAGAQVLRPSGSSYEGLFVHDGEFQFLYVLAGSVTLRCADESEQALGAGDACVLPAGMAHRLAAPDQACRLLQVTLPGDLGFRALP